jgi:ABC-type phosphate transport system ATPase subunit
MLMGRLVEHRSTNELFVAPEDPRTGDYIEGRYG